MGVPAGTAEDPEDVTGYLKTHWDCPWCGEVNEQEGDCSQETATCTAGDCGCVVYIHQVM